MPHFIHWSLKLVVQSPAQPADSKLLQQAAEQTGRQRFRAHLLACRWRSCWWPPAWLWTARVPRRWWWSPGRPWASRSSSWGCRRSSPAAAAQPCPSAGDSERAQRRRWLGVATKKSDEATTAGGAELSSLSGSPADTQASVQLGAVCRDDWTSGEKGRWLQTVITERGGSRQSWLAETHSLTHPHTGAT